MIDDIFLYYCILSYILIWYCIVCIIINICKYLHCNNVYQFVNRSILFVKWIKVCDIILYWFIEIKDLVKINFCGHILST